LRRETLIIQWRISPRTKNEEGGIFPGDRTDPSISVQLFKERGKITRLITAEILENGDLYLVGNDVGEAPCRWFDRDDYEFGVTLEAGQNDRLLLALVKICFSGGPSVVDECREFVQSNGIPHAWMT
jgi:hypothetical protein